jgi:hypothetical protein
MAMTYATETAEQFLDLLMADDEWVDAEFAAIIAASWRGLRPPAQPNESGERFRGTTARERTRRTRSRQYRGAFQPDAQRPQRSPPETWTSRRSRPNPSNCGKRPRPP